MSRNWLPLWAVLALLVFSTGTVWLRLYIVRTTYGINQLDKEVRALQQARDDMELRLTALRSPRRLEALARTQFKLSQPRADQVVRVGAVFDAGGASAP